MTNNRYVEIKKFIESNESKIPANFDWRSYLARNSDLRQNGINNEILAKYHYILYGSKENREYHKLDKENKLLFDSIQSTDFVFTTNKHFVVSTILYNPDDVSINFLNHLPDLIVNTCVSIGVSDITLVIRDHSKPNDISDKINTKVIELSNKYKQLYNNNINICYINSPNIGYGAGHNANFYMCQDSDYFLILNDDMGFPHVEWIKNCFETLESDTNTAIFGSSQSPHIISEFVDGHTRNYRKLTEPEYAEGSILLVKSDVFKRLEGFDKEIKYFYFEDCDLCLRAKRLGYNIKLIDIPHQHFRSNSTKKVRNTFKRSIIEYNRAYFFSKWSKYLKERVMTNKILIDLSSDGIGDIADCFFPTQQIINNNPETNIDIVVPEKMQYLYNYFKPKINYIQKNDNDFDEKNYSAIYSIKDLNFSPPMHTTDLICAKFGIANFDNNPRNIKEFFRNYKLNSKIKKLLPNQYIVAHLDFKRVSFEGRVPSSDVICDVIEYLTNKNKVVLVGQKDNNKKIETMIENKINEGSITDCRDFSIDIMTKLISEASLFIGLNSGPSHIAQLLDIPSFILYGPINPATKIYRYHNSGCYYNTDPEIVKGSYHIHLEPAYHLDIRGDNKFFDIDGPELIKSIDLFISNGYQFDWIPIFNSLRQSQREYLITQMHNPLFKNKTLTKQPISIDTIANSVSEIMLAFENYAQKYE